MKTLILTLLPLVLTGCTITKQAQVSEASPITGVVRLTYNQAMLQTARTDDYVARYGDKGMSADGIRQRGGVWPTGCHLQRLCRFLVHEYHHHARLAVPRRRRPTIPLF